jgi:hypothetical protein
MPWVYQTPGSQDPGQGPDPASSQRPTHFGAMPLQSFHTSLWPSSPLPDHRPTISNIRANRQAQQQQEQPDIASQETPEPSQAEVEAQLRAFQDMRIRAAELQLQLRLLCDRSNNVIDNLRNLPYSRDAEDPVAEGVEKRQLLALLHELVCAAAKMGMLLRIGAQGEY